MINNSAPNHNLLTPENERKRTPPFPERLDSVYWLTQDPCLFLAVSPEEPARSVAIFAPRAQSRDRTEGGRGTWGREKGDKGGGEVTCCDRGVEASGHYSRESRAFCPPQHNRKTLMSPKNSNSGDFVNLFLIIGRHVQLGGLWVKQPYYRPYK